MKREYWLDNLRAFACILVVIGHLLRGLIPVINLPNESYFKLFVDFIYYFHVYIFFFCSGFLFERVYSNMENEKYYRKKAIRILDLLVPYFFFSTVQHYMKVLFSGVVNRASGESLFYDYFIVPQNQMWFLIALSIITLLIPRINSVKRVYILFVVCFVIKVMNSFELFGTHMIVQNVCANMIWYALGIIYAYYNMHLKNKSWLLIGVGYIALFIYTKLYSSNSFTTASLTFLGITFFVYIFENYIYKQYGKNNSISLIAKYMMQIYLLHTILCAAIRIVLMKLGIDIWWIHLFLGFFCSVYVSVFVAAIFDKIWFFNIIFFPSKVIRKIKAM
ncbi:Acyltransferase family protein [Pseudobutyrivibrio sp. 49]|uniref:acyltransferase family protein n=1 Tax=Pseudobutyrivibrio sp. 49 TaxID=1855344 RepID=UPI000886FAE2|nr:acyltransferase [Pseudobutyrivibrio sp. 49]SDI72445.1 Acyltransferase family protein [Pseudobutyrivibrio sp. 49]